MSLVHKRITDLIEDSGVSQEALADAIGVTRATINRFVNGHYDLKLHNAIEIAKFFNISLDYLAGLIDEPISLSDRNKKQ